MTLNPFKIVKNFLAQRELIKQLTKREVISRYKGSYLGILWSFINPLLMLVIYTFVFSVVFKARWDTGSDNKAEFALILFSGIITFNIFAEVINRAPGLILSNANYVKKVVFPLQILPFTILGSALVNFFISLIILIVAAWGLLGVFHWTIIFVPLVILPLVLLSIGLGWFIASIGVYFRDVIHIMGVAVQALMFLSPIFYPISAVPKEFQAVFYLNPISYVVEDVRQVVLWGSMPDWKLMLVGTAIGGVICFAGNIWFQKTQGGFIDVL